MTSKTVALLGFRILALYFLVTGLTLPVAFSFMTSTTDGEFGNVMMPYLVFVFPSLTAGLILWFLAPYLARHAIKETEPISLGGLKIVELYQSAFVIVGLFLMAYAIPECLAAVISYFSPSMVRPGPVNTLFQMFSKLVPSLLKLLMGLWFLLRGHYLAKSLSKVHAEK